MKKYVSVGLEEKEIRHLQKFALLRKQKWQDCLRNLLVQGSAYNSFNLVINPDTLVIDQWPKQKAITEGELQEALTEETEQHALLDAMLIQAAELAIRAKRIIAKNPLPPARVGEPLLVQDEKNNINQNTTGDCGYNP